MTAYYNEIEPFAAEWLRNLIKAGHIAPGDVDERSIVDIRPSDLDGYTQCHFFAGIGVWSHALRSAGWSDDRPVWTGSCPCQPFSAAGARGGAADERHLWPHFFHLIEICRPDVVFGEQVASKDGLGWLDLVQADLEGAGYATGAVDTCAAGFGAPHIRQRLYWVADASSAGLPVGERDGSLQREALGAQPGQAAERRSDAGWVADPGHEQERRAAGPRETQGGRAFSEPAGRGEHFWADAVYLECRDGKARPTKPGIFPLAHGAPARVGRLRAYGNAIVDPQATAFIEAYRGAGDDLDFLS